MTERCSHFLQGFILLVIVSCTTACSTPLKTISPSHVDLSGEWQLIEERSENVIVRPRAPARRQRQAGGNRARKPSLPGRIEMPRIMLATSMRIEQDPDSMGVRFDSGDYRDVDWGKREKRFITTHSGWLDESLIIDTEGPRLSYREVYTLDVERDELVVELQIHGQSGQKSFIRVFQRQLQSS